MTRRNADFHTATPVRTAYYASRLATAWHTAPNVAASLTDYRDPADIPADAMAYMLRGTNAGFLVSSSGELTGLYATESGFGDILAREAIAMGATHLDCFDGYLTTFYGRHGFQRVTSLPNWTPGEPDVVYMALVGSFLHALESAGQTIADL